MLTIFQRESGTLNPIIFVDYNWVANHLGRTRSDYDGKTVDLLSIFPRIGYIVLPIFDGDSKMISVGQRSSNKVIAHFTTNKP